MCFKSGYGEVVDTPDSMLYIKVPQRGVDDDLRMDRRPAEQPDAAETEPEMLQPCLDDVILHQQQVRTSRERRLMALLNHEGTQL